MLNAYEVACHCTLSNELFTILPIIEHHASSPLDVQKNKVY